MRTVSFKFRCVLAALAMCFAAAGRSGADETLTLPELVNQLLQSNPEIQASESSYQAALAKPSQMRSLPDPVVSFVTRNMDGNPIPFTTLGEDPLSTVGFMWQEEFPYPGKLDLSGKVAEKEADSRKVAIDQVRWKAISELKQAYFSYYKTNRSLRVLKDSLDWLKRIEEVAENRYSVGRGIQQDVLRAQLEISLMSQRITVLEQENQSAAAEMNRLLDRPMDSPFAEPAEVHISTIAAEAESPVRQSIENTPGVRSSQAMVAREKFNLDLAKKQSKPDFMTSVEYGYAPNFPDMWEIQFGVRIPIFYKKKQAAGVAEAKNNVTRAEKELRAASEQASFDIKNELLQIQSSEKLLKLYDGAIIPQSKLTLESAIASYQTGGADFLTILNNFLTVLEYRLNYYEEIARHESAVARLETVVGASLSDLKIQGGPSHE